MIPSMTKGLKSNSNLLVCLLYKPVKQIRRNIPFSRTIVSGGKNIYVGIVLLRIIFTFIACFVVSRLAVKYSYIANPLQHKGK